MDDTLASPTAPKTIKSAGEDRPVGLSKSAGGVTEAFVLDEVMVRADTQEALDAFLAKYDGIVLRDASSSSLPEELKVVDVPRTHWYLVRVNLGMTDASDLASNIQSAGLSGHVTFSSEDAARLASIIAREAPNGAWPNLLMFANGTLEHADYSGGHLDTETWKWMNEDDDPNTPEDQGLSVGVVHAWDYLNYRHIPPRPPAGGGTVTFTPVRVGVIDDGFALSTSTGEPLLGNIDYFNSFNAPIQWDEADDDSRAGGASSVGIDGGGSSPWHGQKAFGVCCAKQNNQFGGAGVGGPVVLPMLIKNGGTVYSTADSIYKAANMGANVINISMGGDCGTLCRVADIFWDNQINDAVQAATNVGAVVVAGAGNAGRSLDSGDSYVPCEVLHVICVGSVLRESSNSKRIRTRHNFGRNVAISAPEGVVNSGIFSTLTPDAVEFDTDDFASSLPFEGSDDEIGVFNGTSCATAFVSGVVALVKACDPSLNAEQVRDLLQQTANKPESVDNKVPNGYVDAFRAVQAALSPNQPPHISVTQPVNGQVLGWKQQPFFRMTYNDPEVDSSDLNEILRYHGEVVVTSNEDGELCRDSSPPYECTSIPTTLTLGPHLITATATDAFGASAIFQLKVQVTNRPPEPEILSPLATALLFSHIPVLFAAFIPDPDETILGENVSWESDLDGPLGTGFELSHLLSAGTHVITVTAVDGLGLTASDSVTVTVETGVGAPTPVITAPVNGFLVAPGEMVTLTGEATDPEDGVLPGTSLQWFSNLDGLLGTGNSIQVILSSPPGNPCQTGGAEHTITLQATDSDGKVVKVTIIVRVGIIC